TQNARRPDARARSKRPAGGRVLERASKSRAGVLSGAAEQSATRAGATPDVRLWRHDLVRGEGRPGTRTTGRRADSAVHPGGESRRCRVIDRAPVGDDAFVHPNGYPQSPRRGGWAGPTVGWYRGRRLVG